MALSIGAVVPNFDYARFLPERLASIGAQSRAPSMLVFLDDASLDDSWMVAQSLLDDFPCPVQRHRNAVNSGSVLGQWRDGVARLDTDLVWLAEADDRADPGLMEALAERLEAEPEAILAFCDSAAIGTDGVRVADDSQGYYTAFGDDPLSADMSMPANEFLARCLCPRNLIVSASAVLWRREALVEALAAVEGEGWLCAGDWRVYAQACLAAGARIVFARTPLSEHRRHSGSVTGRTPRARHLGEVVAMHAWLRRRLGAAPQREEAMRRHLGDLRRAWQLVRAEAGGQAGV